MSSGAAAGMEDVKTDVAVLGGDRAGAEARFADLCKAGLGLDEGSMKDAMAVFRGRMSVISANTSAVGSGSPEEIERCWSAMTLYSVAKLREGKSDTKNGKGGFNLSRILRAAQFNAADFFREMPQFVIKAGHILSSLYGSDWEKRLEVTETQANFVHLRVLSNHYKRTYQEYFLLSGTTSENYNINSGNPAFVSECHRFGWLLFLDLLVHAFTPVKDLVTCTTGLVSILIILILHVPVSLRKFSVLDSARLAKKSDKGIELLESLSDTYDTSVDDLRAVMDKTNNLIVDILKKKPLPASECHAESLAGINTDGLLYFEGLMDGSSLQSSLLTLEKDYDEAIYTKGEFDGRMFVSDEDSLLGTGSLSGGAINICSSKCKFGSVASPAKTITSTLSTPYSPASPANGNIRGCSRLFPTPVTTAMATAKWLRTIISPLPSQPTAELEGFLSSCERDVTSDVVRRAQIILEAIFPSSSLGDESIAETLQNGALMDHTWAEQRKMEALKLYYRVLEAICRAESQLHGNNLTSLLSNERFHRCMLACSAELVLATHKTVTMMFPAVLERTGITAFDLSKVIESFVRHEETLPRELKRHLNSLEERLLESMVWEKGSSIYNSLIIARPALSIEVSRLGLEAAPMPPLEAIAMNRSVFNGVFSPNDIRKREHSPGIYRDQNGDIRSPKRVCTETRNVLVERNSLVSPVKDQLLPFNSLKSKVPLQSAFATPTRRNPARGGETCAETGVNIFFNKISKLAAIRIKSLCEKLQLSHQILEHIYSLIQQILNQRTSLFFNRHIDQIILCSFYGVAKISKLALTFKEIINSYRKQPHCKPQVFRSVFVDWSLTGHNGNRGQGHVDIITFYNEVFIPSVKPFLMELGSSGSTLRNSQNPEDNSIANVQCLGSPRLPFPALPDMSPKKVSTTHNVYVSPLRSSKMDALLSPSSKSYYACVGESTHAYQSPSKDLSIINNRLNYGSKMRLNFDMVSDSLVVGTLGPQNGTMSTLPSSTNLKQAVKCEQPDS